MQKDFIFEYVGKVGSLFWLPLLAWAVYFFWCRFLSYPLDLEKRIGHGKVWLYMPIFWKGKKKAMAKAGAAMLFWAGVLSFASTVYFLQPYSDSAGYAIFAIAFAAAIVIGLKIRALGMEKNFNLQQERYFQIYSQVAGQAMAQGEQISDTQLLDKTRWQHQNDLRIADKQGRYLEFLKGQAKL